MRRRLLITLSTLALFGAACTGTATASVAPTQKLVALLKTHEVFSSPRGDAGSPELVPARRPLTLERTVLPVLGEHTGADGNRWLHVNLPGRPNGHTGWIRQRSTVASTTTWRIVVHTASARVLVYQHGRVVRIVRAVVGKQSTPTPRGDFFVEESIQLRSVDVGAPFALALSARSNVLQEFDGGPGQIALHGLTNVGGVLGTAASHGCVRLANDMMDWLVHHVGPGVPVTIVS
jgi:lipoprotein-anchoring transpeptidase ErfK/SrfK